MHSTAAQCACMTATLACIARMRGMLRMQLTAQHHVEGSRGTIRYTSEFHRSLFKNARSQ